MRSVLYRRHWGVLLALACAAALALLAGPAAAEKRLALVIGNGAYAEAPLRNPPNDARAMAQTLRELGFEVIALENADKTKMQRAVLEFGKKLKESDVGLFFYAGHGMQVRGANYLIPVGAQIGSEDEVEVEAVDTNYVLARMAAAGSKFNVVVLDACRNNPFARSFRSAANGLAAITAPTGTLISYATAPGSVAADGEGANGLYTGELVRAIREPGLKIEEAFKRVRAGVIEKSRGQQTPWESSSLVGDFVFRPGAPKAATAAAPAAPAAAAPSAPASGEREVELTFWNSIKDSRNADDFRAYLQTYPQGSFANLAQVRLRALEQAPRPAAPPPAAAPAAAAPAPAQQEARVAMVMPSQPGRLVEEDAEKYVQQHWAAIEKTISAHALKKREDWFDSVSAIRWQVEKVVLRRVIEVDERTVRVVAAFNFRRTDMTHIAKTMVRVYHLENKAPEFRVIGQNAPPGMGQ
jgi:uncharacterized caspase-like protein